jgi:hypothetical protein
LGKFWRVLQYKMLVYIYYGPLACLLVIRYIFSLIQIWQPWYGADPPIQSCRNKNYGRNWFVKSTPASRRRRTRDRWRRPCSGRRRRRRPRRRRPPPRRRGSTPTPGPWGPRYLRLWPRPWTRPRWGCPRDTRTLTPRSTRPCFPGPRSCDLASNQKSDWKRKNTNFLTIGTETKNLKVQSNQIVVRNGNKKILSDKLCSSIQLW